VSDLSSDEQSQIVELKAIRQASDLKIMKLEQMIDEKNRMITELQKGMQSGHDHEVQIEDLKQILQAEIESLKQQNKQLKSEIARFTEENLDLQTKVYAGEVSKGFSADHMEVRPSSPVHVPAPTEGQPPSLSLHDVFGGEEQEQEKTG
jgi:TolA-binding protein